MLRSKIKHIEPLVLIFSFALFPTLFFAVVGIPFPDLSAERPALRFALAYALPQQVSSQELINNAQYHDGKEVIYAGEVIGDIMARGEYAWMNVHDGQNAIGIWVPYELTRGILHTGNYKEKGDWIEVSGIFQHICKQHGGDLDIHATGIKILSSGYSVPRVFNRGRMRKAMILLAVLGCVWILSHLIKK